METKNPDIRFGPYEVDLQAAELRKDGVRLKLTGQPFQVFAVLLERPGEVVTREELQKRLWPDTFVDFDHNLNSAINRIREVLHDSAESPQFVETIPRRGYRFIAPVEIARNGQPAPESSSDAKPQAKKRIPRVLVALAACFLLFAAAGWLAYKKWRATFPSEPVQRALTRFTFDDGLQIGATWSPDGRYIAYSSDRGGKFDIWVQQVSGGNPVQITKGPGQNWMPDWSPDGKYIAYRSEDGDGGIYIVPALGGAGLERKISPFGYYPRWSPDSSQVLFQTHITASNRFYIAQLDGTPPREVLSEFIAQQKLWAASAGWHPDGKRITIWAGDSAPSPVFSPSPNFWTVPISGGPGIKLEVTPAVQRELARASGEGESGVQMGDYPFSWSPSGNAIYLERGYRGARNIWKMTVDPETLRSTGIDRLTTGPGPDGGHAISADGKRLAFTAKSQRIRTWLFPFDAKTGRIQSKGYAISSPGRLSADPVLSLDGMKVAYVVPYGESSGPTYGDARNEVWVKSLVDGNEAPVISDNDYSRWGPEWSLDGKQLVYERRKLGTTHRQIMAWSSQNHEEHPLTPVSDSFMAPAGFTPDGKWLLALRVDGIWLVPLPSTPQAESVPQKVISHPSYALYQPQLSPDGRWIVFEAVPNSPNMESAVFVAPVSGGPWTRITDDHRWNDKPRWSPDGKTIYFVCLQGGFFNLWGIRFDPAAGKPVGQPFKVSKFESAQLMIPRWIPPVGISLTQDKLVMTMVEESGNIWILDNVDR